MEEWHKKYSEIDGMLDMSEIDDTTSSTRADAPVQEGVLGAEATRAGIQTHDLQAVINGWADALNKSAIASSTGKPVRTPVAQYKGFAAEEYFKQTMKINALAKGVPNYKIGIYTKGQLPNGETLSGIDMHSDILVFSRKWPWQGAEKVADAQSKIHSGPNAAKAYAKDAAKEQYAGQEFVGGEGQGVNDKVHAKIGNTEISSDSITPEAAEKLAEDMKAQNVPEYEHAAEKHKQLERINLVNAVKAGAITGAVFSAVGEICYVLKNRDSLDEDQFIRSIQHILCGSIDGGVRGGAIMASVQAISKALGKEIPANSLGAVPVMAAANASVDFAKDLYRCFIKKSIDTDDLLCNSVNNVYSSVAGFGGAWVGGQLTGTILSAKTAAATGAAIGSPLGPIGTVVGSAIGGLLIGIGAGSVIRLGEKDARRAFNECMKDISAQTELEGCEKLYYFADSMAEISEFRISFKDLLPCYNLISDLKEYNIHKKAISHLQEQLEGDLSELDDAKEAAMQKLRAHHQHRLDELQIWLSEQRDILYSESREAINTYVANSYIQYTQIYNVMSKNVDELLETLHHNTTIYSGILQCSKNRNAANVEINRLLAELMEDSQVEELIKPFIEKVMWFMQQDELLIGKQYISFNEAMYLVSGVS